MRKDRYWIMRDSLRLRHDQRQRQKAKRLNHRFDPGFRRPQRPGYRQYYDTWLARWRARNVV